ncbi:MAG: GTP 3',8-cyclase MoaA [Crocinitomicaceae bacterium]|nr:GTP 3',8-cyclase MoaA [Crocinitomicaceae bacterium]
MNTTDSNILTDQFGRVHDYLRISLTERCNLRCFYCMPEEGVPLREKAEFMTAEETVQIAEEFIQLGIKKIRLTGGEPLIKKNFVKILHDLSRFDIELALTTNGILVDQYIHDFKTAGLKSINVSLDSLDETNFKTITRRSDFQRVIKNIDLLLEHGISPKINAVIMRGVNDHELIDFVNWGAEKDLAVRFIEFMPFDGNKWNWDKKVSYQEILSTLENHFGKDKIVPITGGKNDTSRNFRLANLKGSFGIISSVTNPFCDTCNRVRLTADGKIKNCLFSAAETDLLSEVRKGNPISQLIRDSIFHKKSARAGIPSFEEPAHVEAFFKNRSMITIGG